MGEPGFAKNLCQNEGGESDDERGKENVAAKDGSGGKEDVERASERQDCFHSETA